MQATRCESRVWCKINWKFLAEGKKHVEYTMLQLKNNRGFSCIDILIEVRMKRDFAYFLGRRAAQHGLVSARSYFLFTCSFVFVFNHLSATIDVASYVSLMSTQYLKIALLLFHVPSCRPYVDFVNRHV
jgi:hypothetical protein